MKCAAVTTTSPDAPAAAPGLCDQLAAALGAGPDLLMVFYTPHHSGEVTTLQRELRQRLAPRVLLGCPAHGVIGADDEIEDGAGVALWGASWPGVDLEPFYVEMDDGDSELPELTGWPREVPVGASLLVLADPYTMPGPTLLTGLARRFPHAPVCGGLASGAPGPGEAMLMKDGELLDEGAVGVVVGEQLRMSTVVSQGCRPVGRHFVITKGEDQIVYELGGRPALEQLAGVQHEASARDKALLQTALHVGRVIDERKSAFEQGDFLVRNVTGYDPGSGALVIADLIRPGQTIQFMVRDARTASQELEELMEREAGDPEPAVGTLLFSCGGRGARFFGTANHDLRGVRRVVDVPTAGFFAAGEIGPVGGQPFIHGFTASIAIFRTRQTG